jgi:hypothetical protein
MIQVPFPSGGGCLDCGLQEILIISYIILYHISYHILYHMLYHIYHIIQYHVISYHIIYNLFLFRGSLQEMDIVNTAHESSKNVCLRNQEMKSVQVYKF